MMLGFTTATKWTHLVIAGLLGLIYCIVFIGESSLFGAILFFPFIMTPIVVGSIVAYKAKNLITQIILLSTTIAYTKWAVYLYYDAMIIHIDPQSPIVLIFTAILASPFLLAAWLVAWGIEWWASRK